MFKIAENSNLHVLHTDGMNTVDSENHAQYRRSVPQTTDQQIDNNFYYHGMHSISGVRYLDTITLSSHSM